MPLSLTLNTTTASDASIAVVTLDGRIDWILNTAKSSADVLAYAPLQASSLTITPHRYGSVVTGRGVLALTGTSPNIFKVALDDGESFLVARASLLAYSLEDTAKTQHPVPERIASVLTNSTTTASEQEALEAAQNASYLSRLGSKLGSWAKLLALRLRSDTTPFVRLHGPTTLLLQSSSNTPLLSSSSTSSVLGALRQSKSLESELAAQLIAQQASKAAAIASAAAGSHPKDYLKIATVKDGKVSFESTSTFKDF